MPERDKPRPAILVVDDDPYTRTLLEGVLRGQGAGVDFATDAASARRLFGDQDYNLVILDQRLPDGNGLDLFREIRGLRLHQSAILVTGHADVRDAVRAVREGLFDYLTKPFDSLDELEVVVEKALELDRAYREIDSLREILGERRSGPAIIGHSAAIERLLQQVRRVAPLDTTVLLEGESGSGKELAARAIHAAGARAEGRFLDVNCGALSETLLESALFGYDKGAFTGATRATSGLFEEAHGGTLFLDEIADMSPKLQSSLLRVLQERTFSRVGSTTRRACDFRLVCATNRRLADEVAQGRFREDLYYRLNVVVLEIPPLRDRRDDIAPLALHFLDVFNRRFGKSVGPPTPEAIAWLETRPWPGNVRQLEHAIEQAVALSPDGPLDAVILDRLGGPAPGGSAEDDDAVVGPYGPARERFERGYLERLLAQAGGNVSEAARVSGIARQNLYVRMSRYGIDTKS